MHFSGTPGTKQAGIGTHLHGAGVLLYGKLLEPEKWIRHAFKIAVNGSKRATWAFEKDAF
jgi:hypothetical protein